MVDLPDGIESTSPTPTTPNFEEEEDLVQVGRTVENGNLRFLSVSQVKCFDPKVEGGCPARWAWQKLEGKKEPSSDAQTNGKVGARQLAHYLKTGDDCLPPVLRAGKHLLPKPGPDLEIEEELGDLERAVKLRDAVLSGVDMPEAWRTRIPEEIERSVGLVAEGIPFRGAADYRHFRGWYMSAGGVWTEEDADKVVGEAGDHKMTSRISGYVSKGGKGKFYEGYAKTAEQIADDPQWLGYGVHMAYRHPELTHARLSANYYQTKHGYAAEKRTILVPVDELRDKWRTRVLPVVREMVDVAKITDINQAPRNIRSCIQFGKPCPHSDYCERPKGDIFDLLQVDRPPEGETMAFEDLFGDTPKPGSNGTAKTAAAAAASLTDAAHAAAVEAAKAKLAAQGAPATAQYGYCASCGEALVKSNASRLPNGVVKHISCPSENKKIVEGPAERHIGAVNPADGPEPDILRDAAPLSAETIAGIEDPEIKARAIKHAAEVAAKLAAEEAAKPAKDQKTGGRCPESGKKVVLTREEGARRKRLCACGRLFEKIKDAKLIFESDQVLFEIPGHNLDKPKAEAAPAVAAADAPPDIPVDDAPPELPIEVAPDLPPDTAPASGSLDLAGEAALDDQLVDDDSVGVTISIRKSDMAAFARLVAAAMKGEI